MLELRREPDPEPSRAVIHLPDVDGIELFPTRRGRDRWWPPAVVALVVAVQLVVLRAEARPPVDLNDGGLHLSMVRWAADRITAGDNPFDGWYDLLGLGFPQLHHYQSLPHVVVGAIGALVGTELAFHLSVWLLVATWPVAVWGGCLLLGIGRWPSVGAAVVSPLLVSLPGYGYELASYLWHGYGLWPQLVAMWLLPLALGLAHRAVHRGERRVLAGLAVAATVATHFLTGFLLVVVVGVMLVLRWRDLPSRLARGALVLGVTAAAVAWVFLPIVVDRDGVNYAGYERGTFWYDSYGAGRVLSWLVQGSLLDHGRLPVVTVLAGIGLVLLARRAVRHTGPRVVLALSAISLALFCGRSVVGFVLDRVPLGEDLYLHRFIIGVHLGAIVCAGVALAWLAGLLVRALEVLGPRPLVVAVVAVATLLVLTPALRERAEYVDEGRDLIAQQRDAESNGVGRAVDELLDSVRGADGRVFAGASGRWGATNRLRHVPGYALLLDREVPSVGWYLRVFSIGSIVEPLLVEDDVDSLRMFGVRWLLLPRDHEPPVPVTEVGTAGGFVLWEVRDGLGLGRVIDVSGMVTADAESLDRTVVAAREAGILSSSLAPFVAWAGRDEPPRFTGGTSSPGSIELSVPEPEHGRYTFQAETRRDAFVAVAVSWHPRLRATVDGEPAEVVMVAPGYPAVAVPRGVHTVVLQYQQSSLPPLLAGLGLIALLVVIAVTRGLLRRSLAFRHRGSS